MSRPKQENIKTEIIKFRVTKEQKAVFKQLAKEQNLTVTDYILRLTIAKNNK
jgi:uncharacterized protein (DUF1778 family)